ncbi:MAG TPA: NAD(P)/FAD-dependent oxidoreductase [Candidatus Deferrimicrobiaceae bacterium]|nr:NAD(P)/FAD-dependent oxidoreductase [Candidatus Deferrimicrobiaceae bacterium]
MAEKSIIIIGAGLAGLSTGCFAQMNGYKTKIYEMQTKPGGVCVSWQRKDYTFDYAVHNLFGTAANSVNNHLWLELGALEGLQTYSFKEFVQVEDVDGKVFTVHTDLDALKKHMDELSPNDKKLTDEFIKAVRRFSSYDLFATLQGSVMTKLKMLPIMNSLMKYSKITIKQYADQFSDPFLRKAFATIQYDIPEVPTLIPIIFLSTLSRGDGGWPIGGSTALSKNIEKRYLSLGGEIAYNSMVSKVLVENNQAVGVELEDGSKQYANNVVSAADGYSTIYQMLQGKYVNKLIDAYYKNYPKTQAFGLEVWYGINRDLTAEPHALVLFLDTPLNVEGKNHDRLDIEIFSFDPTLAPAKKSVVKVVFESDYDYWHQLAEQPEKYRDEKQKVADQIAKRLEKRFPEFKTQIEAQDVVTPVSVEHWTSSYRGCQAWGAPKEYAKQASKNGISKTLPGFENFYMVGQWAGGTIGLNTVCLLGRNIVKELCRKDNKKFKTTTV